MLYRLFPLPVSRVSALLGILLSLSASACLASNSGSPENRVKQLIGKLGDNERNDRATRKALQPWLQQLRDTRNHASPTPGLQEGIWNGTLLMARSDRADPDGNIHSGLTRWRLHTESGRVRLFFTHDHADFVNGQPLAIRGLRTGNRILVTETARDLQTLLKQ